MLKWNATAVMTTASQAFCLAFLPLLLTAGLSDSPSSAVPEGFERYARLIELVSLSQPDRADARLRWRHYADRGYAITRHDLAASH
jgi:DNA polymerase-3 subunit chi